MLGVGKILGGGAFPPPPVPTAMKSKCHGEASEYKRRNTHSMIGTKKHHKNAFEPQGQLQKCCSKMMYESMTPLLA